MRTRKAAECGEPINNGQIQSCPIIEQNVQYAGVMQSYFAVKIRQILQLSFKARKIYLACSLL